MFGKTGGSNEASSAVNSKGYDRNTAFVTLDGPAINAFNLNFMVQFPLAVGLNYPENADVGLQLNLNYNSRVTNFQTRGAGAATHRYMRIRRQNPFGLGFDLSLGRIIRYTRSDGVGAPPAGRLVYVDSTGANHGLAFFQTTAAGDEWRTHDGSHIRAVWASNKWTVSFPNGIVQELEHFVSDLLHTSTNAQKNDLHWATPLWEGPPTAPTLDTCDVADGAPCSADYFIPDPTGDQNGLDWLGVDRDFVGWHVTKVYTRAATSPSPASYTVEYFGDDGSPSDARFAYIMKFIRDQHGRTIEFVLDRTNGTVSSILTPAAPSEAGARPSAEYVLEYKTHTMEILGQPHKARVLWRMWSPNVATSGAQKYLHTFDYKPSGGGDVGGQLSRVDYPSGKATLVRYARYPYQNGGPGYCIGGSGTLDPDECNALTGGGTCAWSWGVDQLEVFLNGNSSDQSAENRRVTSFSQTTQVRDYKYFGVASCSAPNAHDNHAGYWRWDQVHTMVDPAGNKTEFIYRTPKETEIEDGIDPKRLYGLLVAERYYGGNTGPNVRLMKQVDYVYDDLDAVLWTTKDGEYEMVPTTIATTWADDQNEAGGALAEPTFLREDRSDFDNFGHYQRSEFWGPAVGPERKVVIKDYANDNRVSPSGALCQTAADLQSNWLGDVVAREEVREKVGGSEAVVSRVVHGYDVTRGLRTSSVTRASLTGTPQPCESAPVAASGDIATEFAFTPRGDLLSERRFLPGAGADSSPSDVTTTYTYQYGARESAKNTTGPGLGYYDYVRVIDPSSGLAREERSFPASLTDITVVITKFAYDPIGRTTKITHGADDPVVIAYENETASGFPSPASRLVRIRSKQGSGVALTESVDHLALGRFDHEEKLDPDGTRSYRYTKYNNSDRVSFSSEWTHQTTSAGVPGTTTEYGVYVGTNYAFEDPFGRPTKVVDPLGGVTRSRYFGTNREVTSEGVALKATALDDPASVFTRYFTDGLGRLRFVSEPKVIDPGAGHGPYEETGVAARYTYDVLGRLRTVDLSESGTIWPIEGDRFNATAPSAQARTFDYNEVGRLTTSTSPEVGSTTNDRWNALGDVTRSWDGATGQRGFALQSTYDIAGRPTRLSKVVFNPAYAMNEVYSASAGTWTMSSDWRFDASGGCLQGTPSWYIGDTNCRYAQGASGIQSGTLTSPAFNLSADAILTFKYFREVHGDQPGSTGRDVLRVQLRDTGVTPADWSDVYVIDSTQISWAKWIQSPAINLQRWMPTEGQAQIRFVFDSGGHNNETNLRGLGIAQVTIRRSAETIIQETSYDETFGINKNLARAKPTKIKEYDEATGLPIFTRELHYTLSNGRLSDEKLTLDWDRDGTSTELVASYTYDTLGDLVAQKLPYFTGSSAREYVHTRSHGAVVSVTVTDTDGSVRNILSGDWGPGIEYDESGDMKVVRYANRLQQHTDQNAGSLPSRIWVDRDGWGDSVWDTGTYAYDGARNIKQIGADYYRYDAAARLTWSRTTSSQYGTVDLNQVYDGFGNMTSQSASFPGGGSPTLPAGLTFSGRGFTNGSGITTNRITSPGGFVYDAAGRLTSDAGIPGVSQTYEYSGDGRLTNVSDWAGKWFQSALYEGDGHRWFRSLWAEGGKALVTLRDASGHVVADFAASSASSGLQLQKEYVYANDQLVAINSTCGPRPALALSNPAVVSGQVWFDKTDYVPAEGSYTIVITTGSGQSKALFKPSNTANHFSIPLSEFFVGETNSVQIETDAACGHTGYSNVAALVYNDSPSTPSCLTSVGVSRSGFTGTGSNMVIVSEGNCAAGTTYNVHFQPLDDEVEPLTLNGNQLSAPSIMLSSMPCDAAAGYYWAAPLGAGGIEGPASPAVLVGPSSCGAGETPASQPGQIGMNLQFVHWDHLGSTRLLTDEQGAVISSSKFFPFGYEAESTGGDEVRQKFTGHERDDRVGLDYMLARSCRMALARFLEPDEYGGSADGFRPQSWNRYVYVSNNPVNLIDPSGYAEVGPIGSSSVNNTAGNCVVTLPNDPGSPQPDTGGSTVERALVAGGQYVGGIVRGIAASVTFGLAPGASPQSGDSPASLAGQVAGSILAGQTGISAALGGAGGALITSPAAGTGAGAIVPVASAAVAAVGAVTAVGAAVNLGNIAAMAKNVGGSGDWRVNTVGHSSKKAAKDAARNEGAGKPVQHPSPRRGRPHFQATDKSGNKKTGSTHHEYPK